MSDVTIIRYVIETIAAIAVGVGIAVLAVEFLFVIKIMEIDARCPALMRWRQRCVVEEVKHANEQINN